MSEIDFRHNIVWLCPSVLLTLYFFWAVITSLPLILLFVLSPQIYLRVFNRGLRFLCLLTCSFLSQVKSHPSLKACYWLPHAPCCGICQWCLLCQVTLSLLMQWHDIFSVAELCSMAVLVSRYPPEPGWRYQKEDAMIQMEVEPALVKH